jgi:hypothetical protein
MRRRVGDCAAQEAKGPVIMPLINHAAEHAKTTAESLHLHFIEEIEGGGHVSEAFKILALHILRRSKHGEKRKWKNDEGKGWKVQNGL